MEAVPVVLMQPVIQMSSPLFGAVIATGISPFAQGCLDEALGLAVGARRIGAGARVLKSHATQ
jgi:hypothetical protein